MSGIDPKDLLASALESWRIADRLCGDCRAFHKLRGFLLATGVAGGVSIDVAVLQPLLAELLGEGAEVLIGGIADPGQIDVLVDAAAGRRLTITAADLCPTPLELCRRLDLPPNVRLNTLQLDLAELEADGAYDVVLSHGMLPFVDPDTRIRILQRLARALKPGGRLVVLVRTAPVLRAEQQADMQQAWFERAAGLFAKARLPIPGPEAEDLLRVLASERLSRAPWTDDPAGVEHDLRQAGLVVERRIATRRSVPLHIPGGLHERQGWVFVCR